MNIVSAQPTGIAELAADLAAEHEVLDRQVQTIDPAGWTTTTPAEGWSVADQISHLCYFDEAAQLAIIDRQAFEAHVGKVKARVARGGSRPDTELARALAPLALLERWRTARGNLLDAIQAAPCDQRVPWYAQPMSLASFVTARLMETWAHGQDVADGIGAAPAVSDRLRHVCHLGVSARPWPGAFRVNNLEDSGDPLRVEVLGPDGMTTWVWGPPEAWNRVTGSALDLALVVTRRREVSETQLSVTGRLAETWVVIAQAFAGAPGPRRTKERSGQND